MRVLSQQQLNNGRTVFPLDNAAAVFEISSDRIKSNHLHCGLHPSMRLVTCDRAAIAPQSGQETSAFLAPIDLRNKLLSFLLLNDEGRLDD